MRASLSLKLALAAITVAAGCHLIGGADQYSVRDDAAGGATSAASGGAGGATTATGGAGGAGGCTPTTENCLNGIDDDCDGDVDCDDSACGDFNCQALPAGGVLVEPVNDPGQCGMGLMELELADCSACSCGVDDPGECTLIAELYDNTACSGAPNETITVTPSMCVGAGTTAAMGQTVGAKATVTGVGDASCSPDSMSAQLTARYFCELPSPGNCAGGDVCVPNGANLTCVLLDGDVDCAAPYTDKELVHDRSNSNSCNCSCSGGEQQCPGNKHVHAWNSTSCGDVKLDVQDGDACFDTGFAAVVSLDNHDQPLDAGSAQCVDSSRPTTLPAVKTLCCAP